MKKQIVVKNNYVTIFAYSYRLDIKKLIDDLELKYEENWQNNIEINEKTL